MTQTESTTKNKPTILVITGGYFPGKDFGGIATSRYNFSEAMGDEFDIAIVTRDHDYKTTERYTDIQPGWNTLGKARVWYCSDYEFKTETFDKLIEETKPIVIYASGTITSYFSHNKYAFKSARKHKLPILLTPDGDVCKNAMHMKKLKKLIAVILCRLKRAFRGVWFQATAEEELKNLPKYLGVSKKRITLLPNLPYIFPARTNYHKTPSSLKVVFSARIHPKKNLHFAIQTVCKMKSQVQMDIYGPMENAEYWKECLQLINNAPKNVKIEYKGRLEADEAKKIAMNYDCYFLPTVSENYGYTIEEALLCGCPTVISLGTTPWDDLHGVAGFAGDLQDQDAFVSELEKIAKMDDSAYQNYCSHIAEYMENKLAYKKLCNDYKQLIYKVANKK